MVRGATFDAEGFAPPVGAAASTPPDLLGALTAIIANPDQRFPALKLFAIEELGRQPGREVTAKLIEILRTEKTAPLAIQKAGEMLVARRDAGALDLFTAALRAHADYSEKRAAPPVEILARAIGALGPLARAVAPDLDAHLRLPETSPAAAAEIAQGAGADRRRRVGPGAARLPDDVPRRPRSTSAIRPRWWRPPRRCSSWAGRPIASSCCSWPRSRTPPPDFERTFVARSARLRRRPKE